MPSTYKTESILSFVPVNKDSQKVLASMLNLPVIKAHENIQSKAIGSPSTSFNVQGDGNCLFRALSYAVTGRQIYHNIIRQKIIQHMSTIEHLLKPHMNDSLKDYLNRTKMSRQGTWGTDVELFAASHLLDTDIFVYTKSGHDSKWNRFSKSMLDGCLPKNKCAIYINHTGGVHFDVVLDVSSTISREIPHVDLSKFSINLTHSTQCLKRKSTTNYGLVSTKKMCLDKYFHES